MNVPWFANMNKDMNELGLRRTTQSITKKKICTKGLTYGTRLAKHIYTRKKMVTTQKWSNNSHFVDEVVAWLTEALKKDDPSVATR